MQSNIKITKGHYVKTQIKYLKKKVEKVMFSNLLVEKDLYEELEDDIEEMNK